MLDYIQTGCLLSGCAGAASVHQVSQQVGYSDVDMGRSWRVSIELPFFFTLICGYIFDSRLFELVFV